MSPQCQAKDPNSCRVHGTPDSLQQLEGAANSAVSSKDLNSYLSAKEKIEGVKEKGTKASKPKKVPAPSKREKLLAKAEAFAGAPAGSVEEEARYILLELAGDSEADMFSEAGTIDMLVSLEREEGVAAEAAALVSKFLK
jgi:hypothetical protein